MGQYFEVNQEFWTGRKSGQQLYLHEKVNCIDLKKDAYAVDSPQKIALLGYACDEGVARNQGRVGAVDGPNAIRAQLAKMPNHLTQETVLLDAGNLECIEGNLERIQEQLSENVTKLLKQNTFPILLGGGHDIAYGHYNGIKNHINPDQTIGIINFDAHFDLRSNEGGNNSGTPFYQIAHDCKKTEVAFNYLCLGIREDANDKLLFKTAKDFNLTYIKNTKFNIHHLAEVKKKITQFISKVDFIYVTIDLDGFSSAYAPGVSAASPMGYTPTIVLETLEIIITSKKLISLDIAEMNPTYDIDQQTAKLAASLLHFVMHRI